MDNNSDQSSPIDDDKDDGKKNANRACDFCHRMKMKCIGKETPPCNRCRSSGQQCTFDGPRKSKAAKVEDRLKVVEEQMSVVQSSLTELLALQRASMRPAAPVTVSDPRTINPAAFSTAALSPETHTPPNPGMVPNSLFAKTPQPPPASHTLPGNGAYPLPTSMHPGPLGRGDRPWPPKEPVNALHSQRHSNASQTEPSSQVPSDDEDDQDPLEPSAIIYNNMLSLAEAARLKADGHMPVEQDTDTYITWGGVSRSSSKDKRKSSHPFDFNTGESGGAKKARIHSRSDESKLKRALPLQRGNHTHAFDDAVGLGYCTLERGKQLFDLFMENCAVYVPVFEPNVDTWESLRKRSPFMITTAIMVGAKVEDAGGPVSELQRKCREHAERIGMFTLFTPVARIEALQAMIVLAAWGDTSWRPAGHALRIAMDMGLYRCLPYLASTGMGAGRTSIELAEERPLVVGARCWLALYKIEYEMAYNLGRPALFASEETIKYCRKFLEHPLTIQTDSRLVAFCELLTLRAPMHQPFSIWPAAARVSNLDERIREANKTFDAWLEYWTAYYEAQNLPSTHFLRESLHTSKAHAVLHTNSRILHGLRGRRDVPLLSDERKGLLVAAIRAAETLVNMALRGVEYTANLPYANHYTHVGIAFAARFLIRLTSLMPEAVDLRQTGRDVEQLAKILAQVPGFQFAQHLRDVIVKARRKHYLPPPTRASSPVPSLSAAVEWQTKQGGLTSMTPMSTVSSTGGNGGSGHTSIPQETTLFDPPSNDAMQPLDFMYAEQLFANNTAPQPGFSFNTQIPNPELQTSNEQLTEPQFQLDEWFPFPAWFPFPPLEGDGATGGPQSGPGGGPGGGPGPGPGSVGVGMGVGGGPGVGVDTPKSTGQTMW